MLCFLATGVMFFHPCFAVGLFVQSPRVIGEFTLCVLGASSYCCAQFASVCVGSELFSCWLQCLAITSLTVPVVGKLLVRVRG